MTADPNPSPDLIAFLDANIVLEGKPLADLPWTDLATEGLIRVLIVPQAMEEIDAKKRDGRLAVHARAFNRLIAPAVISGAPVILREAKPRVELQMASISRIPWDHYNELDPDDGDSRIVAEALNVRGVDPENHVLVSHDIKPLAYARGRGLAVYQVSDDWLRPPEPSPQHKEIQRLKQQVAEYKKDEPIFEIEIEVSDSEPQRIYRVAKLDEVQTDALIATITAQNPMKPNAEDNHFGTRVGVSQRDYSYDGKYEEFISQAVPAFAARYHEKLELLFNQRLLTIHVKNAGQIRADHLVVSVRTTGGWVNSKVISVPADGPTAPTPLPDYLNHVDPFRHHMRDFMPRQVGRHEFEMLVPAKRSPEMEASCEDFRSGQEFHFEGVVVPTSDACPLEITVALTAKNLRGETQQIFAVEKQFVAVEPGDLIDMVSLETKQEYPVKEEIRRLLNREDYHWIEWDRKDD
jgi:hypothetical protein